MKQIKVLSMVALLLSGILIFSPDRNVLSAASQSPISLAKTQPVSVQAGWEKRWQDTLAAAKKEGEVEIYQC